MQNMLMMEVVVVVEAASVTAAWTVVVAEVEVEEVGLQKQKPHKLDIGQICMKCSNVGGQVVMKGRKRKMMMMEVVHAKMVLRNNVDMDKDLV